MLRHFDGSQCLSSVCCNVCDTSVNGTVFDNAAEDSIDYGALNSLKVHGVFEVLPIWQLYYSI